MIIYDEQDCIITDPDLTKGEIREEERIKSTATPIDDVTKFAWYDEDYETILRYHAWTPEELAEKAVYEEMSIKAEARELFLDTAPDRLSSAEAMQAETDDALCELYEMIIKGAS